MIDPPEPSGPRSGESAAGAVGEASDGGSGDALARLVHDLRNPLNTLSMNAELLGLEIGERGAASEAVREGLLAIERAVGELERGLAELEARVREPDRTSSGGP